MCSRCGQSVYLVRNVAGETFLVDHSGRRWCPGVNVRSQRFY